MSFDDLETKYFCEHKYFEDMRKVNPWVKYTNAGCNLLVIRQSFDEIKRSYDSTSEVYIQKTKDFDNAYRAMNCAYAAYDAFDFGNFVKTRDISDIAKQAYKNAVKLRIKEMFPVNLEKKLKQIAFERRLPALRAWVAARKW